MENTAFGPHLTIDARGCNRKKIDDLQYIWDFLNDLPDKIGMTKIVQPYVFPYAGLVPEDKGVTGTVIIAESHITFHSFTDKDYFFFDIFSCKTFDVGWVADYVVNHFDVKDAEVQCVERGKHFPRNAV